VIYTSATVKSRGSEFIAPDPVYRHCDNRPKRARVEPNQGRLSDRVGTGHTGFDRRFRLPSTDLRRWSSTARVPCRGGRFECESTA